MMFGDAFIDDGCTLFVDVWRGIDLRPCCDVHDIAFHHGTSVNEFFNANFQLASCLLSLGVWELVIPALVLTCTLGAVFYWLGKKAVTPKGNDTHKDHKDTPT